MDNDGSKQVESEMVDELKPLTPEQRVQSAGEELARIQMKYGVVLAVVTANKTPTFSVTELQILPQERIRQGQ